MLEAGLIVLMMALIGGVLWLMKWWNGVVNRRSITSSNAGTPVTAPDTTAVLGTDTNGGTRTSTHDDRWPTNVSTRDSDETIVTYLAAQRGEDGAGYRFSANEIYTLVKRAPRAEVLDQVRAVRTTATPPVLFPDPENGGHIPASYPVSGRRT